MKELSKKDAKHLELLNTSITKGIKAREEWLDSKMSEYAEFQIGDDIYNVPKGEKLGKVTDFYRYFRARDKGVNDTSLSIDYVFQTHPNCFDNTSRLSVWVGTKADVIKYKQEELKRLTS